MTDAPLMLGVSGLRGIVGKSLTPEVAARFAGAFGTWLLNRASSFGDELGPSGRPEVVIGRDGRAGGQEILNSAVAGLLRSGCDVRNVEVATTPTVAVAVDDEVAQGGMVVTASHNPQQWNGLKCLVRAPGERIGACAPPLAAANEIIAAFHAPAASMLPNAGERGDLPEATEEHVLSVVSKLAETGVPLRDIKRWELATSFSVVLDSVNGSGTRGGRRTLEALGSRSINHLHANDSGVFPHPPEPLRENLDELCRAVGSGYAAIGFAQDPDADRLAIVDERGEYIGEEYTLALAAEALLAGGKGKDRILVSNLSTSRMIDDIAAAHGARVVRTPVGEANVVEAMKREKAAGHDVVLGGEGNGGVIWPKVTYVRDSLSAMALVLALMARTGKKVSELVQAIPVYAIEKRKVELARKEDARPAVEKIAAAYRGAKIDLQDGVRVDWLDQKAWLHVRASNTEPIMRLIAESPTAAQSRAILDEAARVIAG